MGFWPKIEGKEEKSLVLPFCLFRYEEAIQEPMKERRGQL